MKSETRKPKSEGNPKTENRKRKLLGGLRKPTGFFITWKPCGPRQTCEDVLKKKKADRAPFNKLIVVMVNPDDIAAVHKLLIYAKRPHLMPPSITAALVPLMQGIARGYLIG
jgi:hypothetical protein